MPGILNKAEGQTSPSLSDMEGSSGIRTPSDNVGAGTTAAGRRIIEGPLDLGSPQDEDLEPIAVIGMGEITCYIATFYRG